MTIENLIESICTAKLDGYIVPLNDIYFNEYVPEEVNLVKQLCGFTGSAGTLVIMADGGHLFYTDGRYTLQAKQQLGKEFEIRNSFELSKTNEGNLGIDGRLISQKYYDSFKNKPKLISLIDLPNHKPSKKIVYPIEYAGRSVDDKINDIISHLPPTTHYLLITDSCAVNWLLNIRGDSLPHTPIYNSFAILDKNSKSVELIENYEDLEGKISKLKSLQLDPAQTSAQAYSAVKNPILKPCPVNEFKAIKNTAEINGMVEAHKRDGRYLTKFINHIKTNFEGESEISASDMLENFRREDSKFHSLSFDTISGFGSNGAIIHYHATQETNKKFESNNLYLVDSGAQYLGKNTCGTTDVTRTICFGKPTAEHIENYTRVLKGHIAIARARFPMGTSGAQLDILARNWLWQAGLDYAHGTGHGVGAFLNVHEGPSGISSRAHYPLKAGMIISNEPGYYKEGDYGIRIENLVLVVESKHEGFLEFKTLTLAPFDDDLIEHKMLTYPEKKWLENYNKDIQQNINP